MHNYIHVDPSEAAPLIRAAKGGGHEAVVELLLDRGAAEVDMTTLGQTLLSYAAEYGHASVAKILLEYGAEL